jgi:Holliday junction resolvasome RuvABC ATP-dependent DNA helicase subunit
LLAFAREKQGEHAANALAPTPTDDRTKNPMRPRTLAGVIGQGQAKALARAAIDRAKATGKPMDHMLLVAASGTGKSTFSHVIANELGVEVYDVEAPISFDTLLALRTTMKDGDVLKIEEIHQQGIGDRRGRSAATQPEVLYAVMEDRVLPTETGVLPFPAITVIGTTTDEGMLPDAFVNRFALKPRLVAYDEDDLILMAARNAYTLNLQIRRNAARMFAHACRGVPREMNNLIKNAALWATTDTIGKAEAQKVLDVGGIARDGLTPDMQAMLKFMFLRCKRTVRGETRYQASVNAIATAIGKSRDSKAIALRVEPYLIELGYVQVASGGRVLTDAGIARVAEMEGAKP